VVVGHTVLCDVARELPVQGKERKWLVRKDQERTLRVHPQPDQRQEQEVHRGLAASGAAEETDDLRRAFKRKPRVAVRGLAVRTQNGVLVTPHQHDIFSKIFTYFTMYYIVDLYFIEVLDDDQSINQVNNPKL
jgi:hypothetical protein